MHAGGGGPQALASECEKITICSECCCVPHVRPLPSDIVVALVVVVVVVVVVVAVVMVLEFKEGILMILKNTNSISNGVTNNH